MLHPRMWTTKTTLRELTQVRWRLERHLLGPGRQDDRLPLEDRRSMVLLFRRRPGLSRSTLVSPPSPGRRRVVGLVAVDSEVSGHVDVYAEDKGVSVL